MRRNCRFTAVAIAAAWALAPSTAGAAVLELGSTATPLAAPACPKGVSAANCTIILTQVTALETIRDRVAYPTTVKRAGRIVAFTVGLSRLNSNRATARRDIHFLDQTYGGTTRAAITVLKPVGSKAKRRWVVAAEGPVIHLQPYLGQVVQFALPTSLPVTRGDVVGLTVPTWAPVLSIQVPSTSFAYRQSRSTHCKNPPSTNVAQLKIGQSAQYGCNYAGTRVEYSATEVTNPVAIAPIHAKKKTHA